jgi:peptidylprolyl isomerase
VLNFNASLSTLRGRLPVALLALAAALIVAGCGGSSSHSETIALGNENSADQSLIKSGGETAAAKTPTSGPLSEEPKVTPPTGKAPEKLESKDLIVGTGPEAKTGDSVTVNYVGVLYKGGKEFDASWKRKEPFSFTLGKSEVIKGWDQGVVGMKVGGRRELIIPPGLAYGAEGSGSSIPPNSPLIFVIDLLGT